MKALLIIAWLNGQANIPMPDLILCQMVGATVQTDENTEVYCVAEEDIKIEEGVDL